MSSKVGRKAAAAIDRVTKVFGSLAVPTKAPRSRWRESKIALPCAVFAFCLCLNVQVGSAQKFQWDFSVGDQFEVTFDQSTVTQTTVTEKTTNINSSTRLEMAWSVLAVDRDNNYLIEQAITSIRLSVTDPASTGKSVALDTADSSQVSGESATILKQVKPLINLKFNITITPTGDILSVDLPDDTVKVLRELPGSLQLQALFSEQGVKDLFGASAVVFPEDEIDVGYTWKTSHSAQTAFGEFTRNRSYEFAENRPSGRPDSARFRLETTLEPVDEANQEDTGRLLEYTESGEMWFNLEAGFASSFEVTSLTKTELPYREKLIQTRIENLMRMTVLKK